MTIAIETENCHPTTQSCMDALAWLQNQKSFQNVLDMGCGSGILSVLSTSMWESSVLAADISHMAIKDTQNVIKKHGLEGYITPIRSDGFANSIIKKHAPYDLIIVNILSKQLISMAPLIKSHLSIGGTIILSGILAWETDAIKETFSTLDFEFVKEFVNNPWYAYIACHKTDM